jgi:hypothetical protein
MRARAAYISSLGTTTILVCAALLLLAVGSALVAFRGWPGGADGRGVQRVVLTPNGSPRAATEFVRAAAITRLARAQRPNTSAASLSTAGLVKVPPGTGPGAVVQGIVVGPGGPGAGSVSSPQGASYPPPTRSPFQAPPPSGRDPGPTAPPVGYGVPVPVPNVSVSPPSAPAAVTNVAATVLSSAPPPPSGGPDR